MPSYATQINDPWTSVDMVLPVDDKFSCILKAPSSIKAKCHEQDNLLFDTGNELPYNLK